MEDDSREQARPVILRAMDARIYDWNSPTAIEQAIELKLNRSDLPAPVLERLEAVQTSIEQMRRECKRLSIFA